MKNEQIIYDKFIERQKALQIIKICEENSIFFNIYTEKLTISKSLNYNILFYNNENKNVPEDKKTNIKIIENIYKCENLILTAIDNMFINKTIFNQCYF